MSEEPGSEGLAEVVGGLRCSFVLGEADVAG